MSAQPKPKPKVERYYPSELRRLHEMLEMLHLASYPRIASGSAAGSRSASNGWNDEATPDAARRRYRRALERALKNVDRLARRITVDLTGDDDAPAGDRSWRCSECRAGQRAGARYCDRCGHARPDPADRR